MAHKMLIKQVFYGNKRGAVEAPAVRHRGCLVTKSVGGGTLLVSRTETHFFVAQEAY